MQFRFDLKDRFGNVIETKTLSSKDSAASSGVVIGMNPDCWWPLRGEKLTGVSQAHATLQIVRNKLQIIDTSTNGTAVDDRSKKIPKGQAFPLKPGNVLFLGKYEIEIANSAEVEIAAPEVHEDIQAGGAGADSETERRGPEGSDIPMPFASTGEGSGDFNSLPPLDDEDAALEANATGPGSTHSDSDFDIGALFGDPPSSPANPPKDPDRAGSGSHGFKDRPQQPPPRAPYRPATPPPPAQPSASRPPASPITLDKIEREFGLPPGALDASNPGNKLQAIMRIAQCYSERMDAFVRFDDDISRKIFRSLAEPRGRTSRPAHSRTSTIAQILTLSGGDPDAAAELVDNDIKTLGDLLTRLVKALELGPKNVLQMLSPEAITKSQESGPKRYFESKRAALWEEFVRRHAEIALELRENPRSVLAVKSKARSDEDDEDTDGDRAPSRKRRRNSDDMDD